MSKNVSSYSWATHAAKFFLLSQQQKKAIYLIQKKLVELFHMLQHAAHGSVKWKGIGCPWNLCVAHLLQPVMATCHQLAGRGSSVSGVLFHWQTCYCMGAGTFETWVFPHTTPICCNTSQIPFGSREMLWHFRDAIVMGGKGIYRPMNTNHLGKLISTLCTGPQSSTWRQLC